MQTVQIHSSQSLRRVQLFLTAHADTVAQANQMDARKQLDSAVTAADAAAAEKDVHDREIRAEVQRREELEHTLVTKFITPLAKYARASMQGVPDFAELTPATKRLDRERLVNAGRAMATSAEVHADLLSAGKFPADFASQIRTNAEAIQASLNAKAGRVLARNNATKQVALAVRQGRKAVAALDSLVSHLIHGDEALQREWETAVRLRKDSPAGLVIVPATPAAPQPVVVSTLPPVAALPVEALQALAQAKKAAA